MGFGSFSVSRTLSHHHNNNAGEGGSLDGTTLISNRVLAQMEVVNARDTATA